MSKRDELIQTYAAELKDKCGITPDTGLLTKVTAGLGPSIYNADSAFIAGSDKSELETVKKNFLIKKLGMTDGPALMEGIDKALDTYGRSNARKHRAVVYYLLVKHFGKEGVYA